MATKTLAAPSPRKAAAGPKPTPASPTTSDVVGDSLIEEKHRGTAAEAAAARRKPVKRKARKAAELGHAANARLSPDAAIAAMCTDVMKASGGRRIVTSLEAEELICGIPLPALAVEYLFQQTVLPLSRALMIYGDPGSCKSAFLDELYRWFMLNDGLTVHIDNENKDAVDLRNAIFWYDRAMMARCRREESNSQEDWQRIIVQWLIAFDRQFARVIKPPKGVKKKDGERAEEFRVRTAPRVNKAAPGYVYPLLIGLDSITATSSDQTIQNIKEAGHTVRRFQIEAAYLSDFAKSLPEWLRERPAVLAFINHRKDKRDERTGAVSDGVPGGNAMRYMDTTEIKTQRIKPVSTADYGGVLLRISIPKNSLGETGGAIEVLFKWWWELDDAGEQVQRAVWDWDTATVKLLLDRTRFSAARLRQIQDLVDIREAKKGYAWSKKLGVPEHSPVAFSEIGRRIHADRELVDALRLPLHIKKRTEFVAGIEYEKVREHLESAQAGRESAYTPRDLSAVAFIDEEIEKALKPKNKQRRVDDDEGDDDETA